MSPSVSTGALSGDGGGRPLLFNARFEVQGIAVQR